MEAGTFASPIIQELMSKIFTLVAFLLIGMTASAQNSSATIKGKLIDSVNKQSLKDASVTILDARDSSLEKFGLVTADGSFSVAGIPFGAMVVQIKFNGYETFTKNITFRLPIQTLPSVPSTWARLLMNWRVLLFRNR
jgi:hypothetical protein